jgi:hypothetical protein
VQLLKENRRKLSKVLQQNMQEQIASSMMGRENTRLIKINELYKDLMKD